MGFSGGSGDKESAYKGRDPGSIPGYTIPVTHKQWLSKVTSKINATCLPPYIPSHNCLHTRTARLNLQCDFNLSSEIVLFPSVKKRKIDPRCSHRSAQSFKRAHRLSQNQDDCKMSLPKCAKYAPMWARKDMGDHWIHKIKENRGSVSCPVGSGAGTGCLKPLILIPITTLDGRDYYYYLFHRWENWGSEKLSHLPHVTLWVRRQAGNWVHAVWHQVCEE